VRVGNSQIWYSPRGNCEQQCYIMEKMLYDAVCDTFSVLFDTAINWTVDIGLLV